MTHIGIDLGGTKIEVIALDDAGATLFRHRLPTPQGDYCETLATIAQLVHMAETQAGNSRHIGIGTDLCDIRRIERTLERFGRRFIERLYAESEQAKAERRPRPADSYAQSFAAKEACAKALGTGFRQGVFWRDMGVVNLPSGRPTLELTGGAARALALLTPDGHEGRIDLSITDDFPTAQAIVIISAISVSLRD